MKKLEIISEVRSFLRPHRSAQRRIGLVPTMGALHQGHRSLIRAARTGCDIVVVSIFVNPTQFGPNEDYRSYPRPLEDDLAICRAEGVDVVFCPAVDEMYPPSPATTVEVTRLTENLCGAHRPGHFSGVTTVVAKLFNVVQPDLAYFGQKDAQQAVVIRKMVRDLLWPIEIVVCPTIREPDGLALSSRNAYLSTDERRRAVCLSQALQWAREQIASGERTVSVLVQGIKARLTQAGAGAIDYVDIVDADELAPREYVEGRCLLAVAVRIGKARLIDNLIVEA